MTIKNQPNRYSLLRYVLSCLAVLGCASTTTAQNSSIEFPYQALVVKDDALVRSGPGKVHYGTQKLSAGEVVEVYRHDPDGWCAIRPVEGSFCIIPESTVEIIGEGIGEIKLAGTTPFVGTKLGSVEKPLWQVKLREKEKVSLIGQLSWPSPEGHSTVWYQIKPPAGEFRWINVSNLESLSGETIASVAAPNGSPTPLRPKPDVASIQKSRRLPPPPAVEKASTVVTNQPTTQPSFDVVATQQLPVERFPEVGRIPSRKPTPLQNQSQVAASNNFGTDQSNVERASFAPTETTPPLQDSGSGWRRATRAIPSDRSSQSANAGFSSAPTPNNDRSQLDSSFGYNRSRFNDREPYDLNLNRQTQQSYSGQVRVADANPDRSRFADQLNQLNRSGIATTYTGQPSTAGALQALNNRLTAEMLKAPAEWQLDPLEAATRQYMANGTYADQQSGQQFLAKLANCRQIAAGYGGGGRGGFPSGSANGNGFSNGQGNLGSNTRAGSNSRVGGPTSFVGTRNSGANYPNLEQFDATGWLNELKQSAGTQPSTYVLQDQTGKIIYHVTPSPGVNLNRYLKKRIGVNGQLGFNQRLNLKHVTISRVFPL